MRKLARFLKNYRLQVILGPIFKLTEAVFELIVPIVTADIIDNGVRTGDVGYVWRMGGVMLLILALVALEKHLSAIMIIGIVSVVMMYVGGTKKLRSTSRTRVRASAWLQGRVAPAAAAWPPPPRAAHTAAAS